MFIPQYMSAAPSLGILGKLIDSKRLYIADCSAIWVCACGLRRLCESISKFICIYMDGWVGGIVELGLVGYNIYGLCALALIYAVNTYCRISSRSTT